MDNVNQLPHIPHGSVPDLRKHHRKIDTCMQVIYRTQDLRILRKFAEIKTFIVK